MDGTSLQAKLYRSRMNEARRGADGPESRRLSKAKKIAAQKKRTQLYQRKINKVVAKALADLAVEDNDEGDDYHIRDKFNREVGQLLSLSVIDWSDQPDPDRRP